MDIEREWRELEGSVLHKGEHIKTGAEARIFHGRFLGFDAIIKDRYPRGYRVKELDTSLRKRRVRTEAGLLLEARGLGVNTPCLLDLDLTNCLLVMEYLPYPSFKGILGDEEAAEKEQKKDRYLVREAGRLIGILHDNNIVHGDLTTSNILVNGNELWFIDFGLAEKTAEVENKGVDLHVFAEAFESTHSALMPLLDEFFEGYLSGNPEGGGEVIKRAEEISKRGRYT